MQAKAINELGEVALPLSSWASLPYTSRSRTISMPDNSDANIAAADALTLLLYNQHAICAAIEEVTKWLSENGVESIAANAIAAMETLDANAQDITDAIMRLRQSPPS